MTSTNDESNPAWTPEEQEILDVVARRKGREWVERYADLILEQARGAGELE